jgi:uncharacterized protein YebE (UPF0316 family)
MNLVRYLATIALIMMALLFVLGIVKLTDALSRMGAILGAVIALIFSLCIFINAWLGMTLWEKIGLVAVGLCVGSGGDIDGRH